MELNVPIYETKPCVRAQVSASWDPCVCAYVCVLLAFNQQCPSTAVEMPKLDQIPYTAVFHWGVGGNAGLLIVMFGTLFSLLAAGCGVCQAM